MSAEVFDDSKYEAFAEAEHKSRGRVKKYWKPIGAVVVALTAAGGIFAVNRQMDAERQQKRNENVESVLLHEGWNDKAFDIKGGAKELILTCTDSNTQERSLDINTTENYSHINAIVPTNTVDNQGRAFMSEQHSYDLTSNEGRQVIEALRRQVCPHE